MKKLLLTTLGISTSLLAITPEQQKQVNEIFSKKEQKISQSNELGAGKKQNLLQTLKEEKEKVEKMSDEEVEKFLDNEAEIERKQNAEIPLVLSKEDEWIGIVFGSTAIRVSSFIGGDIGASIMGFATIGPRYSFTGGGWVFGLSEGFSISLPIGLGFISTPSKTNFALPLALELNYIFGKKFGISGGARYTYSPQDRGDLNMIDIYAGLDLFYGVYVEAGYILYSSQEVKIPYGGTRNTNPLGGAVIVNFGWRF